MSGAEQGTQKIPSYAFRRLLEESPFTDAEIADAASVSDTTVHRWRNGDATPAVAHVVEVHEFHARRLGELREFLLKMNEDVDALKRIMGLDASGNGG